MPKRKFIPPWLLTRREPGNFCPNLGPDSLMRDLAFLRVRPRMRMGGTCRTTTYEVQVKVGNWYRQFSFCWRPDVTLHHLGIPHDSRLRKRSR